MTVSLPPLNGIPAIRLAIAGLFVIVSSLLCVMPAWAAQVEGLYQAEAPVAGVEAAARNRAIRSALEKVLVKVTGNPGIAALKGIGNELDQAAKYVQQYSYRLQSMPPGAPADAEPQRLLRVIFDAAAVDRMLRQRGLPVWNGNRPSILVWMGLEQKRNRRLLQPDLDNGLTQAITRVAEERGLPVLFPLMDLEDQARLQVADLWGGFESNIRAASERYGPDLILTGRLSRVAKEVWRGRWRLYRGDGFSQWENEAGSSGALAADAMQHAADLLAERFAPAGGDGGLSSVRIRVSGVHDLETYARVGQLLATLSNLERLAVVYVEPNAVTYDLHGRGGMAAVEQRLLVGGVLMPDQDEPAADGYFTEAVDLYFKVR